MFGEPLKSAARNARSLDSIAPGCCHTGPEDVGLHTVCIEATAEFLAFSEASGNDLPRHALSSAFRDLSLATAGASAPRAGAKPSKRGARRGSFSRRTHEATLELVELGDLKRYAIDLA